MVYPPEAGVKTLPGILPHKTIVGLPEAAVLESGEGEQGGGESVSFHGAHPWPSLDGFREERRRLVWLR